MRPAEPRGQVFNQGILMSSRCLRFAVLICALFGVGGCGAGENAGALSEVLRSAATTAPVDSNSAFSANGGGCYLLPMESPADLKRLQTVNPEWAPVVHGTSPQSVPVLAHGIARESHVSKEDFPAGHVTFDQNTELDLDPDDRWLLASGNGDPNKATLELEWETGSYPAWAWPGVGDRVVVLGRWIFDCGHPGPGTCHGTSALCDTDLDCAAGAACEWTKFTYRSEIHPPQATAVIRSGRGGVLDEEDDAKLVTRADVWVSADGGGAGDSCVVTHRDPLDLLIFGAESARCFPLREPLALIAPADGPAPFYATDFSFDLPLPAVRGGGEPFLRTLGRETPAINHARIPASLRTVPKLGGSQPHFEVTVRMTKLVNGARPTGFAATILAGWRDGPEKKLAHLRVSIEGVVVRNALKAPTPGVSKTLPEGWKMQVNVNGEWQEIAGLEKVGKTGLYPVSATYDLYLPRDGTLSVHADASSTACVDTLFGRSLLTDLVQEFGFNPADVSTLPPALAAGSACLADIERDAGEVNASFAGPRFGVKAESYELASVGGAAADGAFNLRFRVERIREDHDGEEVSLLQPGAR